MAKEYSKKELWQLYEKAPQELKEAIFSEETAESIWNICLRNEIEDQRVPQISRRVGHVLLGILPPDEFQDVLEKEVKLEKDVAKKVAQEIHRFVFYPVKTNLEELYKIEITPLIKSIKAAPLSKEEPLLTKTTIEEKPTPSKAVSEEKDTYREPLEEE